MDDDLDLKPLSIFLSYSRKDIILRDEFIAGFYDQSLRECCTLWNDDKQRPGWDFDKEIRLHLGLADLIVLLITPNFLASHYCMEVELPAARKRAAEEGIPVIGVRLAETLPDDRLADIAVWPASDGPLPKNVVGRLDVGPIATAAKRLLAEQLKRDEVALANAHRDHGVELRSRRSSLQALSGAAAGCAAGAGWTSLWAGSGWSGGLTIVSTFVASWMAGVVAAHVIRAPEVTAGSHHRIRDALAYILFIVVVSIFPGLVWGGATGLVAALLAAALSWSPVGPVSGALIGLLPGLAGAWGQALSFGRKHLRLFTDINDPTPGLRRPASLEDDEEWDAQRESRARKLERASRAWADMPVRVGLAEAAPADAQPIEADGPLETAPPEDVMPSAEPEDSGALPDRLILTAVQAPEDVQHVERLCAALRSVGGGDIFRIERVTIADEADLAALEGRLTGAAVAVPLLSSHFSGGKSGFLAMRLAGATDWNEKPMILPVLVEGVAGPQHKLQALPKGGPISAWRDPNAAWTSVALSLRSEMRLNYLWLLEDLHRASLWPRRVSADPGSLEALLEHSRLCARAERSSFARFAFKRAVARRFTWSLRGSALAILGGGALILALAATTTELAAGTLIFAGSAAAREGRQFLAMFARDTDRVGLIDLLISPSLTSGMSRLSEADGRYARGRMALAALKGAAGWCLPLAGLMAAAPPSAGTPIWAGALSGLLSYLAATGRVPTALCALPQHRIDDWGVRWGGSSLTVGRVQRDGFGITTTLSGFHLARSAAEALAVALLSALLTIPLIDRAAPPVDARFLAWAYLAVLMVRMLNIGIPSFPRNAVMRRFFFRTWVSGTFFQATAWLVLPALLVGLAAPWLGLGAGGVHLPTAGVAVAALAALRWRALIFQNIEFDITQ